MAALSHKTITSTELPAKGRKLIFDNHKGAPAGFGLRVTPHGKRTFVLRYKTNGKDRLLTIGDYPTWTLAAARKQAAKYKRQTDSGTDILEKRRTKRAENTVADIAERSCTQHADKLASGKAIRGTVKLHLIPAIGNKKIGDLRRRDVIEMVEKLADSKPRLASLLLTYAKQIMEWAESREIIAINPVASLKAKKISKAMSAKARARVLDDEEITTLWNEKPDGMHRATWLALKFILATGQRPGEVCKAEKSELKKETWIIPATHRGKTEDAHFVPLTDIAWDLIQQAAGERHLFERYRGKSIDVNALSHAVRDCSPRKDNRWTPHDLRRTMRTGLAAAGVSENVAELAVGHVRKGIVAVYDQHRYDAEKRKALESWERRLQQIINGEPDPGKVVSIHGTTP